MSQSELDVRVDQTPAGAETSPAPALPACPLNDLPPNVHNFIHALEERIRVVEAALVQNSERTKAVGQMIFKNPATKMFLAAMPKDVQNRLKEMFGSENGNSGTA